MENAGDFSDKDLGFIIKYVHPGNEKYWEDRGYTKKMIEEIVELKGVQFKHGHLPTSADLDANMKQKSWAERKAEKEGQTNYEKRLSQSTVTPPHSSVQKPLNPTPVTVHEKGNEETIVITQKEVPKGSLITTPVTPTKKSTKWGEISTFPKKRTK
jgi:hypothetical protein